MYSIGVITYHHYYNYGTMLQAFALQKVIEQMGYKCEIIDFKQDNTPSKNELLKLRLKRMGIYLRDRKKYFTLRSARFKFEERNLKFENFYSKNLIVTEKKYKNSEELIANPPLYDGYIVGSDQTWNPNVGKNPDAFYLTFVEKINKCGSYAPSVGLSELNLQQKSLMKDKLKHIKFLSCREQLGASILQNITGRKVQAVLDPTLLISNTDWVNYESKVTDYTQKYILQYFLGDVVECREFVRKLSLETNLPVIILPHSYLDVKKENTVYCGPDGFLDLIHHAEYICTDSFHGIAFSINFNKNFFAFHKYKSNAIGSDNSRITDLLTNLGLKNRLIQDYQIPHENELTINYKKVNERLNKMRINSVNYLKKMLEEIVSYD